MSFERRISPELRLAEDDRQRLQEIRVPAPFWQTSIVLGGCSSKTDGELTHPFSPELNLRSG